MDELAKLPDGRNVREFPLDRFKLRLRLRESAQFPFQHGGLLQSLLGRILGPELPVGLFPLALESGHVKYAAGDAYDFALTAVGECRSLLGGGFEKALRGLGQERRGEPSALGLAGNFELERVERLPAVTAAEVLARAAGLAGQDHIRLLLHAPLLLRRPTELSLADPGYCREGGLAAGHFLTHLWRRFCKLGPGAIDNFEMPALPGAAKTRAERLHWCDLPMRELGGLCGSLVFEGLPEPWLRLLVLMENCHLGSKTHYGLGAYAVEELPAWRRPARSFADRLGPEVDSAEAIARILGPAAIARLDDDAASRERGLARCSADGGLRQAQELGMNGPVGGAAVRFVESLGEGEVVARLEALWPGEKLVQRVAPWLRSPAGRTELAPLLAKVFAVELADALEKEGRRLVRMGNELRVLGRQATRVA